MPLTLTVGGREPGDEKTEGCYGQATLVWTSERAGTLAFVKLCIAPLSMDSFEAARTALHDLVSDRPGVLKAMLEEISC